MSFYCILCLSNFLTNLFIFTNYCLLKLWHSKRVIYDSSFFWLYSFTLWMLVSLFDIQSAWNEYWHNKFDPCRITFNLTCNFIYNQIENQVFQIWNKDEHIQLKNINTNLIWISRKVEQAYGHSKLKSCKSLKMNSSYNRL